MGKDIRSRFAKSLKIVEETFMCVDFAALRSGFRRLYALCLLCACP